MSTPNIKFIYAGQFRYEVNKMQKGPAKLQNLYGSILHPQYMDISMESKEGSSIHQPPLNSKIESNSSPPTPSIMIRYSSTDNLKVQKVYQDNAYLPPTLNIDEVNVSEVKIINKQSRQSKKANNQQTQKIILKAPSFKFVPNNEGQIAVHSKRQYKKNASVQKIVNGGEANMYSRKKINNNNKQQAKLQSGHPILKLEQIKEKDFKQSKLPKYQKNPEINDEKIVLKAPKYRFQPKSDNDIVVNKKKTYTKVQNTEKYIYNSKQPKQDNQFIACFGCIDPPAKKYPTSQD